MAISARRNVDSSGWACLEPKIDAMRKDMSAREVIVVTPLIVLLLLLGFYPKPVTDVINPAVKATFSQIGTSDPNPTVAQGGGK